MGARKKKKDRLTPSMFHEVMDRAYVCLEMFDACVIRHPATAQTPTLKAAANRVAEAMGEMYQIAGEECFFRVSDEEAKK